jgi:hypothetical protein
MNTLRTTIVQIIGLLVSRIIGLPPNVSLQGTYGFMSKNLIAFIASIVFFDALIGGFYTGVLWTYFGFAGYYLLGCVARKSAKLQWLLLPVASLWFFFFSNLGSFIMWYEPTLPSFIQCYTVALPFFAATLVGDAVFGYTYLGYKFFATSEQTAMKSPKLVSYIITTNEGT